MRIHCYFINWNDAFYIPFFHKHYSTFCEKIIMYDQYSTDGSIELAASLGIEVRNFGSRNQLNDQWYLDVKNHCWKECRGKGIDYVIVVDVDEFIVIPDNLEITSGGSERIHPFPKVSGFNMISEQLPINDIFEIKTGEPSEGYSKQAVFNPDYVTEINFVHGCHKHNAVLGTQNGYWFDREFKLFHYRMIGGVNRIIERHAIYRNRLSPFNKKHKMGFHYEHSDNAKRDEWNYLQSKAKVLW